MKARGGLPDCFGLLWEGLLGSACLGCSEERNCLGEFARVSLRELQAQYQEPEKIAEASGIRPEAILLAIAYQDQAFSMSVEPQPSPASPPLPPQKAEEAGLEEEPEAGAEGELEEEAEEELEEEKAEEELEKALEEELEEEAEAGAEEELEEEAEEFESEFTEEPPERPIEEEPEEEAEEEAEEVEEAVENPKSEKARVPPTMPVAPPASVGSPSVTPVKRGPGRPRKNLEEVAVPPVLAKRGPGRPRKNPENPEIKSRELKYTRVEEPVKRGPGRPRKNPENIGVLPAPEKRKLGRPRKNPEILAASKGGVRHPMKAGSARPAADPATTRQRETAGLVRDRASGWEWSPEHDRGRWERERRIPAIARLRPGMILEREYEGRVYRVEVQKQGYKILGKPRIYPTLYSVVKEIAGTIEVLDKTRGTMRRTLRWSAPRFFGLQLAPKTLKDGGGRSNKRRRT